MRALCKRLKNQLPLHCLLCTWQRSRMAASGIAEHNEARRREVTYLRKAYESINRERSHRQKISQNEYELATGECVKGSSYQQQVENMQGPSGQLYNPASVDRSRRKAHLDMSRQEYSAKLPHRYSSVDYISQW